MSYHQLSTFERGRIEELLTLGYSHRAIAKRLGRHHSCIDRKLKRNKSNAGYTCVAAQSFYHARRLNSKPLGKRSESLISMIEEKLSATCVKSQVKGANFRHKVYRFFTMPQALFATKYTSR